MSSREALYSPYYIRSHKTHRVININETQADTARKVKFKSKVFAGKPDSRRQLISPNETNKSKQGVGKNPKAKKL